MDQKTRNQIATALLNAADALEKRGQRLSAGLTWTPRGSKDNPNVIQSLDDIKVTVKVGDGSKTKTTETSIRLDARDPDKIRVDRYDSIMRIWEAIDDGDGFKDEKSAKAFALKWLKAAQKQGTYHPKL